MTAPAPRPCLACGQHDLDPRHQIGLADGSSVFFHHDCHALADPPCESCKAVVDASGGLSGAELAAHLTKEF